MKTLKIINVLVPLIIFISSSILFSGCSEDQILVSPDPRLTGTATSGTGGLSDVVVNSSNVTITIWDDSSIDGDMINIFLNNNPLLQNHTLVAEPGTEMKVTLQSGKNVVKITALNQGSLGDNTAAIKVSNVVSGESEQSYSLLTGESATFNIILR